MSNTDLSSNDPKSLLYSKTFWGAAVAGVSCVVQIATHHTISAADQAQVVSVIPTVIDAISSVSGVAGSLLAIYGRVAATKQIGAVPPAK